MTWRKENLQYVRVILIKKYVRIYENGMAEWLRAPWKVMMSLGIEETKQFFYEFPVMLSNNLTRRRKGNI